jgi:ribosomal protein S18 acetylase RimI-like enzyme
MDASAQRPKVAQIFPPQHAEAATVLGRAFIDDPLISAIVGNISDPIDRAARMARLFGMILGDHRKLGQPVVGVMHEGRVGAAAIIEQVSRVPSVITTILQGFATGPKWIRALGFSGLIRAASTLDTLLRNRPAQPHLYLYVIGVEPELQRRHFGVALLDYLRDQVDQRPDLAGVYLETAAESNAAYYSHAGYKVIGEIRPLGVRTWRMIQPRAT